LNREIAGSLKSAAARFPRKGGSLAVFSRRYMIFTNGAGGMSVWWRTYGGQARLPSHLRVNKAGPDKDKAEEWARR